MSNLKPITKSTSHHQQLNSTASSSSSPVSSMTSSSAASSSEPASANTTSTRQFSIENLIYPSQHQQTHTPPHNPHHPQHHKSQRSTHQLSLPKRLKTPPGLENLPIPPAVVTHIPPPISSSKTHQSSHQKQPHIPIEPAANPLFNYQAAFAAAAALFNPNSGASAAPAPSHFNPFLHPTPPPPPPQTSSAKNDPFRSNLASYQRYMSSHAASYMSQLAFMANLQQQQQQQVETPNQQ